MFTPTDSIPYDGPVTYQEIIDAIYDKIDDQKIDKRMIKKIVANIFTESNSGIAYYSKKKFKVTIFELFHFKIKPIQPKKRKHYIR